MQPDFPAHLRPRAVTTPIVVRSADLDLPGVLHLPAGPGPHPVVLVLHGFPGYERNFDVAHHLRRAGYASLVFHYRGSWGAAGTWSWAHVVQDCSAAVDWVRTSSGAHRLDPDALAIVGHSLGGFAALRTAAAVPEVRAVASVAAFDLGFAAGLCRTDPGAGRALAEAFDALTLPLAGTSGPALVDELMSLDRGWELTALVPALRDRAVLLLAAEHDEDAPVRLHHEPLVAAFEGDHAGRFAHHVLPTDHAFSDHRQALAGIVCDFLAAVVPPRPA
ncbi:alpha/beta fold hydrolase [Actinomycetes bacterium KLBMP 9759]